MFSALTDARVTLARWMVASRMLLILSAMALLLPVLAFAPASQSVPSPTIGGPVAIPAARYARNIVVITIEGEISATTARSVKRRLASAVEANADAVVIELNTPGGEVGAVLEICGAIKRSPIQNIVAWVRPDAYSGGAIIALACTEVVVSDGATMGDALPIRISMAGLNSMSEAERQKFLAPLLAEVVDSARLRGYDEKLVQGMVSLGVELWLVESVTQPGTFLFLDRAEYRVVFGEEPTGGQPVVPSAAPIAGAPVDTSATPAPAEPRRDRRGRLIKPLGPSSMDTGQPNAPDATPFLPAAPNFGPGLQRQVNAGLSQASARPVITSADKGQWRLVEFVSDGRGIITLKSRDLLRFGLAQPASTSSGTINNDEELKAYFQAVNLVRLNTTVFEVAAAFLELWPVKALLLIVFLLSLFIEVMNPGLILPGTVAGFALLLLVAPPMLVSLNYIWAVVAILAGISLIALEIFVLPGFGVFGVLGLVLLFGGLVGVVIPTGGQGLFPGDASNSRLGTGLATFAIALSTAGVGMYLIGRHLGSLPILNRLILSGVARNDDDRDQAMSGQIGGGAAGGIGTLDSDLIDARGVVISPLRPSGRVQVGERIIDAVADTGYIPAGAAVRIIEASSFRVVVERVDEPGPGAGGAQA